MSRGAYLKYTKVCEIDNCGASLNSKHLASAHKIYITKEFLVQTTKRGYARKCVRCRTTCLSPDAVYDHIMMHRSVFLKTEEPAILKDQPEEIPANIIREGPYSVVINSTADLHEYVKYLIAKTTESELQASHLRDSNNKLQAEVSVLNELVRDLQNLVDRTISKTAREKSPRKIHLYIVDEIRNLRNAWKANASTMR
jgi:hypothetical protein